MLHPCSLRCLGAVVVLAALLASASAQADLQMAWRTTPQARPRSVGGPLPPADLAQMLGSVPTSHFDIDVIHTFRFVPHWLPAPAFDGHAVRRKPSSSWKYRLP